MEPTDKLYLVSLLLYLFVALIVLLGSSDRLTKNWARFFSLTQGIMAIQVAVGWLSGGLYDDFGYLFSTLNNPFFLGTALVLLERNPEGDWRSIFGNRLFQTVMLLSLMLLGVRIFTIDLHRVSVSPVNVAITLVSVFVYFIEGYAYYTILAFYQFKRTRYLPMLVACLLSALELILSLWPKMNDHVGVLMIALRFVYLVSPFMMVLIRMPQDIEGKEAFGKAVKKRDFILSSGEGFLEALGKSIAAEEVILLIKKVDFSLEDSRNLFKQFQPYYWPKYSQEESRQSLESMSNQSSKIDDCLYKTCKENRPVFCKSDDGRESIMLPIIMYGGVIGVLVVKLKPNVRARSIFAEKLKLSVQILLPLVQSSRQWSATSRLSNRFTANLVSEDSSKAPNETELTVTNGIDDVLLSLLNNLSPLGVAIQLAPHFNSKDRVLWKTDQDIFTESKKCEFERKYFNREPDNEPLDGIRPYQTDLEFGGRLILFVEDERDSLDRPSIGVHPNVFDALAALTSNALKTIIRHNLDKILSAADRQISEGQMDGDQMVQVLQEAVDKFGIAWMVIAVDQTRFLGSEDRIELAQKYTHFITTDGKLKSDVMSEDGQKLSLITFATTWTISSPQKSYDGPVDDTENPRTENKGHSSHPIWFYFGMEDPEFRLDHTWTNIFHEFIELGENKIKEMLLREAFVKFEAQRAAIESRKAIMSLLYLRGNLTHAFGTLIKHHKYDISKLTEDLNSSGLVIPENVQDDLEGLKSNYEELWKLAKAMFKDARHIKLDDLSEEELTRRPSDLGAAIEIAYGKMKSTLDHSEIMIELPAPSETPLLVDAPFLVVYLSIFNLLSNAINALRQQNKRSGERKISIVVRVNDYRILCRISDTGPGLPDDNRLHNLESGWGLFLTKVSLEDYNCRLNLVENSASGATFELSFAVRHQDAELIAWPISNAS